ncbi:MAG: dTMP kinase [Wenzhouxiangellaceae bacterium]
MNKGRFIVLEGVEGAGKSTASDFVQQWLAGQGRTVVATREPGGTPAAERIRALLLDPATGGLDALTELLLMFAARRENVINVIEPALARGQDVVCDRFTDASHAYQGAGRGLGARPVEVLSELVHPGLVPDLVLILDLPVAVGRHRIAERGNGHDRIEDNRIEFFERVRQAYLERAAREPGRYAVVDASQEVEAVKAQLERVLSERLR